MIIENIPPKFQSDPTKAVGEDTFYWKKLTTAQRIHTHTHIHTKSDGYSPR